MAAINATYNTIVINNQDNVATALVQLHKGDQCYELFSFAVEPV